MPIRLLLLTLVGVSWGTSAHAQCSERYGAAAFGADITALHKALGSDDQDTLKSAGARLASGLPCTDIVPPVPALATAYRFIGVHHALADRKDDAGRFFKASLGLDPNFEWGVSELSGAAEIRALFDSQKSVAQTDPRRLEGKAFVAGAGNAIYIDGRLAKNVEATQGRPHLVQVVANNRANKTYLIDGTAFPDELIGDAQAKNSSSGGGGGPVKVARLRPPAKTPLLVVGSVSLLVGGGLYAASMATRSSFDSAETTEDLLKHKSNTNALVIGSAASLVIGIGTGYAGVILDGRPGLVYHLSY